MAKFKANLLQMWVCLVLEITLMKSDKNITQVESSLSKMLGLKDLHIHNEISSRSAYPSMNVKFIYALYALHTYPKEEFIQYS